MVLMPEDIESRRLFRSLARLSRPCAVKKLLALSRAELTRFPVARSVWVLVMRFDVCCNCSRLVRTPVERTMSDILRYLSGPLCRTGNSLLATGNFTCVSIARIEPGGCGINNNAG